MKNQILLLTTLSALLLSACSVEVRDKEAPVVEEKPAEKVLKLASTEELKYSVSALPEANKYQISFTWAEGVDNSVRIHQDSQQVAVLTGADYTAILPVDGGAEVSYLVEHVQPDGKVVSFSPLKVKIPRDTVWNGPVPLTNSTEINEGRLFITADARITVFDKNLTINAEEIYSDRGVIETFPIDSMAAREAKGLSGGTITITAKKATGNLQVKLRGQNGGYGRKGPIAFHIGKGPRLQCFGSSGGDGGASGNFSIRIVDGKTMSVNVSVEGGQGGLGSANLVKDFAFLDRCTSRNTDGVNGATGAEGYSCQQLSEDQPYVCRDVK